MGLFKKNKKQTEVTPKDLAKRLEVLETRLEESTKETQDLKKKVQLAICKVGVTRFNPFKEIGGDQSFCIALLNEHHNGVIVTSYYGRELNRVYAKVVERGVSKHELSGEEREAIEKAMNE